MSDRILFHRRLECKTSVEALWPALSDTNQLNRALGLPPVDSTPMLEGTCISTVTAKTKGGIPLSWEEPPFEWIEHRSYSVRRALLSGPIGTPKEIYSGMRFFPNDSGSLVELFLDLDPQNTLGSLLAKSSFGEKGLDALEKLCLGVEERLRKSPQDPYPLKKIHARVKTERMEQSMQALQGQVPQQILDLLSGEFRHAREEDLLHIRPFVIAARWRLPKMDVLRAFLRAARLGALDVGWVIVCPYCRLARAEYGSLSDLRSTTWCEACKVEFKAEFDRNVEVRFSVNRSIRKTVPKAYCIGGPGLAPHRLAQLRIDPAGRRSERLELPPERMIIRALRGKSKAVLVPDQAGSSLLTFGFIDGDLHRFGISGDHPSEQGELRFKPGPVELVFESTSSMNLPIWATVDREAWHEDGATAALVTTLQEFRDFFSSEVLSPAEQIHIKSLAIMFTDIKGSTALYERIGDAKAYNLVREHFRLLTDAVRERRGAVVKTLGDAIMAVFLSAEDSLACAFDIQSRFREQSERSGGNEGIVVKLGIHLGPAIVVNTKNTLDYFGTSVNIASRIQATSLGGDIVVSKALYDSCREALRTYQFKAEPFEVALKGLADGFQLWRLTPITGSAG